MLDFFVVAVLILNMKFDSTIIFAISEVLLIISSGITGIFIRNCQKKEIVFG